jgi:Spy/CpxP family protein refolding chaperone
LPDDVLGAIVATARVIGALVLLFFLPGFLLVNALYPRRGELDREYDRLYRITLGIVLSIAVTVFWSFFLNSLGVNAATGLGYVLGPNVAAGLLGLSALFFVLGWWRGAYPWMARLHPALARVPKPGPGELLTEEGRDHRIRMKLQELAEQRERLRRAIKDAERRMRMQSSGARTHYEEVRDRSRSELKAVEAKLRELEAERAAELY